MGSKLSSLLRRHFQGKDCNAFNERKVEKLRNNK